MAAGAGFARRSAVRFKRAGDAVIGRVTVWLLKGLRRIDPDRLRTVSEELVVALQKAAPGLGLRTPSLEEGN